jgi:hypothetical protein
MLSITKTTLRILYSYLFGSLEFLQSIYSSIVHTTHHTLHSFSEVKYVRNSEAHTEDVGHVVGDCVARRIQEGS